MRSQAYRSEPDRPDRRLWAITFVVVHRFPKTRRFSSSLAVPELRSRAGCTTRCNFWGGLPAPASPGPSGRKTAARLPLCQPPTERGRLRVLFGVPSTVRSSESLLLPDLRFLTTKDRLHKPPPLATRFSVTQIAKLVKATYLGGELRPQKPTSTGAPPIHVPLTAAGPAQRAAVLFARVTSEPERYAK